MAPSLIPRAWLFQGLLTGISMMGGYAIGASVGATVRWLGFTTPWSPKVSKVLWWVLLGAAALSIPLFTTLGAKWQTELRLLFGMEGDGPSRIIAQLIVGVLLAIALLTLARLFRKWTRWVSSKLSRWVPRRAAIVGAVVIVAVLAVTIVNDTVIKGGLRTLNSLYATSDKGYPDGRELPVLTEHSGSLDSLSSWDSLGYQGRNFVTDDPSVEEIKEFAATTPALQGAEAKVPIRVYAGLSEDDSLQKTATHVVAELDRTHAWDREVLVVATATGTGWIDPSFTATLELMHGGDTAIASMQYSYLPSWVSFVSDRNTPPAAGRALFEAVYEAWLEQPEENRPELYVYGLSLGSYGMQGAFSGLQDMTERTNGALFVGTPSFTPNWQFFTEHRDAGSPEIAPVFDGADRVRFSAQANGGAALMDYPGPWKEPRVAYLQHSSDAVTWWSPNLMFSAPDWLNEPAGVDRRVDMIWLPTVTFWQVTFDMFVAGGTPPGHGHSYHLEYTESLAALTTPNNWSQADSDLLMDNMNHRTVVN